MTTILTDKRLAHIGRRSEHTPDDGMMLRRRLIRSDEDLARSIHHKLSPVNICR
jgi:hypothetical protein